MPSTERAASLSLRMTARPMRLIGYPGAVDNRKLRRLQARDRRLPMESWS